MEERVQELEAQVTKLTTAVNKLAQIIIDQANFNKQIVEILNLDQTKE